MSMSPGSAVLTNMIVPGLAHLQLGKPLRGLLAFATAVGLFFAGWAMIGDRLFYMRLFDPFGFLEPLVSRVPINMLPELPNLGSLIVASLLRAPIDPDSLRAIRAPIEGEHLAMLLCGASGLINALWCVDAHWLAGGKSAKRANPAWCAALTWLLPGAGHAAAGQKDKGFVVGGAVLVVFALGLVLSSGHAVDRPLQSAWWIPTSLVGVGVSFTSLVTGPWVMTSVPEYFDVGVAFCAVAGLMNLTVMIDAYSVAERGGVISADLDSAAPQSGSGASSGKPIPTAALPAGAPPEGASPQAGTPGANS